MKPSEQSNSLTLAWSLSTSVRQHSRGTACSPVSCHCGISSPSHQRPCLVKQATAFLCHGRASMMGIWDFADIQMGGASAHIHIVTLGLT